LVDRHLVVLTWDTLWSQHTGYVAGEPSAGAGGGMIGAILFTILAYLFDVRGTQLVILLLVLLGILLLTNRSYVRSWTGLFRWVQRWGKGGKSGVPASMARRNGRRQQGEAAEVNDPANEGGTHMIEVQP